MATSVTDQRAKYVLTELADLYSRTSYAIDLVSQLDEPIKYGESLDVPSIGALTVYADGSSSQSAQAVSNGALTLTVDQHPWIPALLPRRDQVQNLANNGGWAAGVAKQAAQQLKAYQDTYLLKTYLALGLCYDTSATYHDNVALATLTAKMITDSKAALKTFDGVVRPALVIQPYGESDITSIVGFALNDVAQQSNALGLDFLGKVAGVPVYTSNSIPRSYTVATTAAVTTGTGVTHTYTVAAGHGLVPGLKVTVSGVDADETIATATAITSVTATTVVVTTTATNDGTAADGVGTITVGGSWAIMMDLNQIFAAQQLVPDGRIIPDPNTSGDILQVFSLFGVKGRAGRARVLHMPT